MALARERAVEPKPKTWPVLSGTIPFLAPGFNRRPETGHGLGDTLRPGVTVILGPDGDGRSWARRPEGTGKTQLAAAFAHRLWAKAELDLLVWLDASSRDRIVAGYARALAAIRVAARAGEPEAAAARLMTWLADTGRSWLVVLDGLAELADAEGLWPSGPNGQTLVTTQIARLSLAPVRRGAAVRHAASQSPQQVTIAVSSFSQREALQYLSDRLNDDPYQSAGALDLAAALGCQPVGLNLAVAYLLDTGGDCRQYRIAHEQYRRDWANGIDGDALAPAWMLAVDRAAQAGSTGLVWPALRLAAVLGPGWVPAPVLTSATACAYVTGRRVVTSDDQADVQAAFGRLQQLGLVSVQPEDPVRTVRMPAALQSSVRSAMGSADVRTAVQTAADALCESWPDSDGGDSGSASMEQALRDCAASLRRCDELALWSKGCHPLLVRVGQSLDDARMLETAHAYWRDLVRRAAESHGTGSPVSFLLDRLASAAMAAGHADEAIKLREELAADMDEAVGPTDRQALTARTRLALAYRTGGRLSEAILLGTRISADSEQALGPAHAQTRASLRELGSAYCDAGRYREALEVLLRCLALTAETSGVMDPETVSLRHQVAEAFRRAGRAGEAVKLYQQALAQAEHAVGAAHPDALATREALAIAYYRAGRTDDAATTLEQALADWRRAPGSSPAGTIEARTNLAAIYCLTGRTRQAIPLYESVLADRERIRGAAHPDTFRARWNLAAAYHHARRLAEAVELGEATLADGEQILGPGHPEILTTRANLAHAYHASGRLKRASAHFDRALRDCEQALGADDPLTTAVRDLRKRYLSGRQGVVPIVARPDDFLGDRSGQYRPVITAAGTRGAERARHAQRGAVPAGQ
jgi:tetratricopeptide (TPR) repeat protein